MHAADITDNLAADFGDDYLVTTTTEGWTEVRVRPERAIGDKADFARVVQLDDHHFRLIHLTHNEVYKGEVTFVGSMLGFLPAVVREFCEVEF